MRVFIFLFILLGLPLTSSAINVPNFNGFIVFPAKVEVSLEPGESISKTVTVRNQQAEATTFDIGLQDIKASVKSGEAVELLGNVQGPYSLKTYAVVSPQSLTLEPGEERTVKLSITVPRGSPPAGLYGAVTVSSRPKTNGANALVTTSAAALIFVRVEGMVKESGQLKKMILPRGYFYFSNKPVKFALVYQNTGTTYLNPYGYIEIKPIIGRSVERITVDPWFILPGGTRIRELAWPVGNHIGWYTATVYENRGYGDILDEKKVSFILLPWWGMLTGGLLILTALSLVLKLKRRA